MAEMKSITARTAVLPARPEGKPERPMSRAKQPIDPDYIRELAELITETDLTEIEVQQGDLRIRVARNVIVQATIPVAAPAPAPIAPAPAPGSTPATNGAAPVELDHPGLVKSPMVGTAYRGPAPGAPSFVQVGSKVLAGERLLIVEAMKTFNDITAPKAGTVTAIFIEDKQPIEYGEPLLIIE